MLLGNFRGFFGDLKGFHRQVFPVIQSNSRNLRELRLFKVFQGNKRYLKEFQGLSRYFKGLQCNSMNLKVIQSISRNVKGFQAYSR